MYQESYLGMVAIFAGNRVPINWMLCNGQLLSIPGNDALFNLIGTTYGGDGVTNFALPNLCGRTAVHAGQAPGMQAYTVGQAGGNEQVTITLDNIPSHTHGLAAPITALPPCSSQLGELSTPGSNYPAQVNSAPQAYSTSPTTENLGITHLSMVTPVGPVNTQTPVSVLSPFLAMNYLICTAGIFPPHG